VPGTPAATAPLPAVPGGSEAPAAPAHAPYVYAPPPPQPQQQPGAQQAPPQQWRGGGGAPAAVSAPAQDLFWEEDLGDEDALFSRLDPDALAAQARSGGGGGGGAAASTAAQPQPQPQPQPSSAWPPAPPPRAQPLQPHRQPCAAPPAAMTPAALFVDPGAAAPPPDATLQWRCEHACMLSLCGARQSHRSALQQAVLDACERLEDPDAVMSNRERDALLHRKSQGKLLIKLMQACESSGAAAPPQAAHAPPPAAGAAAHGGGGGGGYLAPAAGYVSHAVGGAGGGGGAGSNYGVAAQQRAMPPQQTGAGAGWVSTSCAFSAQPGAAQPYSGGGGGQYGLGVHVLETGYGDAFGGPPPTSGFDPAAVAMVDCAMETNDGSREDDEWNHGRFAWTQDMYTKMRDNFGLNRLRGNQLRVVNATMSGRDVLVLMPTGGGKSLCYQLPALLSAGLTVVVSPLLSLIQDQLQHLEQANVPSAALSAHSEEEAAIYSDLYSEEGRLRCLYVTPEKVARSPKLLKLFSFLESRGRLARFVVDEVRAVACRRRGACTFILVCSLPAPLQAHCISAWGHDFRRDYQSLCLFKARFPEVPVLALTATATGRVRTDLIAQLRLQRCLTFVQTFNRKNLRYEVHKKTAKAFLSDMQALICRNHRRDFVNGRCPSGIVYCFSQADCEKMATAISALPRSSDFPMGITALPYHAGLPEATRRENQRSWSNDRVSVVCATVAFGMGINKPDVRFVLHHSLPKSLECYFQESGRAGRDGREATCAVFYSYGDARRARSMLHEGALKSGTAASVVAVNDEALNSAVAYCENEADCRRSLLLAHFGEQAFDRALCRGTCDNCAAGRLFEHRDVTLIARALIDLVHSSGERGIHMTSAIDVFRGSTSQAVKSARQDRMPGYGAGKEMKRCEAERLIRHLVTQSLLVEECTRSDNAGGFSTSVSVLKVQVERANALARGDFKVILPFVLTAKAAAKAADSSKAPSKRRAAAKDKAPPSAAKAPLALGPQAHVADASGIRRVGDASEEDEEVEVIEMHDAVAGDLDDFMAPQPVSHASSAKRARKSAGERGDPALRAKIVEALDKWTNSHVERTGYATAMRCTRHACHAVLTVRAQPHEGECIDDAGDGGDRKGAWRSRCVCGSRPR